MKVRISLELDTTVPVESEVVKLLRRVPTPRKRKELLLSSVLYFTRSPSYLSLEQFRLLFENYLEKFSKLEIKAQPSVQLIEAMDLGLESSESKSFVKTSSSSASLQKLASQFEI